MRACCLQLGYPEGESAATRLAGALARAREWGRSDLLVLPELWNVGFFHFDDYERAAASLTALLDGLLAPALDLAASWSAVVVAGSVIERDGDALYNTVVVVGPDGLCGTYRKHHLFDFRSREAELLQAGPGRVAVDSPVGRIGLATCYDLRFPSHFQRLRRDGADLVVLPAAWPAPRVEHWPVLVRARAIETQTPIMACNGAGRCAGVQLGGRTTIVDARGEVLAAAGDEPGIVGAVIDNAATRAWRRDFPLPPDDH